MHHTALGKQALVGRPRLDPSTPVQPCWSTPGLSHLLGPTSRSAHGCFIQVVLPSKDATPDNTPVAEPGSSSSNSSSGPNQTAVADDAQVSRPVLGCQAHWQCLGSHLGDWRRAQRGPKQQQSGGANAAARAAVRRSGAVSSGIAHLCRPATPPSWTGTSRATRLCAQRCG